jgi:allantoate deiminase
VRPDFTTLAETVLARCRTLAAFSEDSGSTRRTFLSPAMHDVHRETTNWLEPLGVTVRVDAMGNLRAVYPASETPSSTLLIGSHLDTVPNAGAFDGILGVVLAVACLEALNGEKLSYAVEVVGFSEEEGVRFGVPFIGSRALIGRVDDDLLNVADSHGISVRKAIQNFGLDPCEIGQAVLQPETCAYLEFHIEQGPALEKLGLPLAAVEAIAGQSRWKLTFLGRANHAGTTPMDLRFDAVAAAAEWITLVEQMAKANPGLVATIGSVKTKPGATNVIASEAHLWLDVRHGDDAVRNRAADGLVQQAKLVAQRRGLSVRSTQFLNQSAVAMDSSLTSQIEEAIRKTGCTPHRMVSGAGHDAMILAERIPSAMIFLRTPAGISHDPAESVQVEDVAKAIECGVHLLHQLASTPTFQPRTCRA